MSTVILLSNDDGYNARGIQLLLEALDGLGELFVAAPDGEQSASSHSLTLRRRIVTNEVKPGHFEVTGTPTDSVLLAVTALMNCKPDLLVSGINHGPNMGEDVTYSGTVAAAIEGTILGIPSLAISCVQRTLENKEDIVSITRTIVKSAIGLGVPGGSLLNVNIPNPAIAPIKGVRITKLGTRHYENLLTKSIDQSGKVGYTVGGEDPTWKDEPGTDIAAVRNGYVSITPLHLDMTDYKAVVEMEQWRFQL